MSAIYGIIGAMEVEIALLLNVMSVTAKETAAGMTFHIGTLHGKDVVVVKSGVGKVNAALCTELLIERFHATHVLNTGVAGSLDARIDIGDFVLSTDAVCHDVNATVFGYAPGEIPQMNMPSFAADDALREALSVAVTEAAPERHVFHGRIASGDQFIADPARKEEIRNTFQALCCEMEGAGVAQAAVLNGVPFCIIRAISDKADGSDTVDYPVFEEKAAKESAAIVIRLLGDLDASADDNETGTAD